MRLGACALAALILVGSTLATLAEESCSPKSVGAKILRSRNVADVHPDWAAPNQIGLSWSLVNVKHEGRFLSGQLVTPRGGTMRGRVYVLADEWDCGE